MRKDTKSCYESTSWVLLKYYIITVFKTELCLNLSLSFLSCLILGGHMLNLCQPQLYLHNRIVMTIKPFNTAKEPRKISGR